MPFARTWSEEVVAEYAAFKGYLVVTGLLVGTGGRGGRKEVKEKFSPERQKCSLLSPFRRYFVAEKFVKICKESPGYRYSSADISGLST